MDAHGYLESLIHFGQKFGLETMTRLCEALGNPQRAFPALLIAGTNGKGSVTAYLDYALRAAGLHVGRYTSPHLVRVNERLVVGGAAIRDAALDRAIEPVRAAADGLQASGALAFPPTYFEALTAAAFVWFREEAVDAAVLEVGMGGRLDATNVSDPQVSAIVSIALDHEAYLGSTLDAIAREKAGVLRPGRVTVLGPLPAAAQSAVEEEAGRIGARLRAAAGGARWGPPGPTLDLETPRGTYRGLRPLPGAHQRDNLLVAVRLLEAAAEAGLQFDVDRAVAGLSRTEWPGRLQWIPGEPPLLLDGAHNVAGAQALAAYLHDRGEPFVLLFGAMRDKAVAEMAAVLFPMAREIVLTQPPMARAATPDEILAAVPVTGTARHAVADVSAALALARERARGVGPVVVAGSLYLIGAVLARLEAESQD